MKPLTTILAVVLPCTCTVTLALMHILRAKSTMDQSDSDPMCLAYVYVSFGFFLLHSRLVKYLSNLIDTFCTRFEPDTPRTYGILSWTATTLCIILETATLIPFAYRALALLVTTEPMIADALYERFEPAAWTFSAFLVVVFLISPRHIPSRLLWVRFTIVYLIMLAAPAYMIGSAHYTAATSQVIGKMLNPRTRVA